MSGSSFNPRAFDAQDISIKFIVGEVREPTKSCRGVFLRFLVVNRFLYFGKRIKLDWNRGHPKKAPEEINFVADPVHLEIPRSRAGRGAARAEMKRLKCMLVTALFRSHFRLLYSSPLLYRSETEPVFSRIFLLALSSISFIVRSMRLQMRFAKKHKTRSEFTDQFCF